MGWEDSKAGSLFNPEDNTGHCSLMARNDAVSWRFLWKRIMGLRMSREDLCTENVLIQGKEGFPQSLPVESPFLSSFSLSFHSSGSHRTISRDKVLRAHMRYAEGPQGPWFFSLSIALPVRGNIRSVTVYVVTEVERNRKR